MSQIPRFLLIIGAMKAGTTSLFEYLADHPQVSRSSMKEPAFFVRDERSGRGRSWYEAHWDWNPKCHRVALEASTSYTRAPTFEGAPERMLRLYGREKLKLIYLLRDPIERIISQFNHGVCDGWFDEPEPGEAGIPTPERLIAPSRYALQLDQYMGLFERSDVLLLDQAELDSSPRDVLEKICKFADLDPNHEFNIGERRFNRGEARRPKHPLWLKIKKSAIGRVLFEYIAMRYLPRRIRHFARRFVERRDEAPNYRPTDAQIAKLREELESELIELRDGYDFDIRHWPTARALGLSDT
ncbi:MAG: sulfotransferase domain-containing protein [Myxococcota bacterium]